jgi:adenine phosphoribosyltransferase
VTDPASGATIKAFERHIREVPDFPQRGISFKDITPLVEEGPAFHAAVEAMVRATESFDYDRVLCAEARGFVFGTALAYRAKKGLILARKPDKLPRKTVSASYDLEYGTNALEIHVDSIPAGTPILVVDDLLATGGTARAMCQLVENAGGLVAGVAFLTELRYLNGRELLDPYEVTSLLAYDNE